jgi:hypothetical protein
LERETGFEPATSTLARSHSTAELLPLGDLIINDGLQAGKQPEVTSAHTDQCVRCGSKHRPGAEISGFRSMPSGPCRACPLLLGPPFRSYVLVMANPLGIFFRSNDLAIPHVDDLIAIGRRLRVMGDHQHSLAQFAVGLPQHA